MQRDSFFYRHVGPNLADETAMLKEIEADSLEQLVSQTIPEDIRLKAPLEIGPPLTEYAFLQHARELASKNKVFKSYIGLGYNESITPSVIFRNIFENPAWYTAYTPYQSEIAQGRLEALINFQTMIVQLTGMDLANASLLDEGTAAAEAMIMLFNLKTREQKQHNTPKFFVSEEVFPQTLSVLKTRASLLGIDLVVGNHETVSFSDDFFGALVQYPAKYGEVYNYDLFVKQAHAKGVKVAVAADILSLSLLTPPGEFGADVVVGSTQRFGIPLGFGGPHAAYFATKESYKRTIPGRLIGATRDAAGHRAYRMALQTREQHIKRDKATSNICTSQVLLAVMAGMYTVYHGFEGIKQISQQVHYKAVAIAAALAKLGISQKNKVYFDTLSVAANSEQVKPIAEAKKINFLYAGAHNVCISINEATSWQDAQTIVDIFAESAGKLPPSIAEVLDTRIIPRDLERKTPFLTDAVFNIHRSESEMMRYIKKLELKDLSLVHSMIPLGSCTMKLNAASQLRPLGDPNWHNIHPFAPKDQTIGYSEMLAALESKLATITGLAATSLQPNSGAQGEYAGLAVIMAFHKANHQSHRNVCLIPSSAHGTNPASAVLAGMQVVVVKTTDSGDIDTDDLSAKAEIHKNELAALMITYPSTHGVFETSIRETVGVIHRCGGQVYMDGANMNAQVGLTNPGAIGADVCHLNLHKTFAIPHGGGGPGVGAICVAEHLAAFLPTNPVIKTGGDKAIEAISAAPFGSALISLISYGYIKMLGTDGLANATKYAILNANYIKARLGKYYAILYSGSRGRVAHEMIVDFRPFKAKGIEVVDVAKRLMDYGFHAPTVSFPIPGTLMIEPTESESKVEIDRFCDALIAIYREMETTPDVLKNAPHTLEMLTASQWSFPYTREEAAYPLSYLKESKFWPAVRRADEAFGDRNLVCTCAPIEAYSAKD